MTGIPALVDRIPDDFKPLASLCIGAVMLVGLALFHGTCLHYIQRQHRRGVQRLLRGRPHRVLGSLLFGWSVFLMLDLHLVEILIWAFALRHIGLIVRAADAIYFCANAYTTLGFGTVDLATEWRNLVPIIAISGLFTFAWTTSTLVTVITTNARLTEQLEKERELEIEMRHALRKQERELAAKERVDERAERVQSKTKAAGNSVLDRYRAWREERRSVSTIRREALSQLVALRRKERADEEKLGPGKLPGSDDGE